jgi:hypothetical protein
MASRPMPATNVVPVKSARWQRLQSRLIRLRAPSNVQSSQTGRDVADEQYLADQLHDPSRSKQNPKRLHGRKTLPQSSMKFPD